MYAVHPRISVDIRQPAATGDCVAEKSRVLLEGAMQLSLEWLEQVSPCDPQHERLFHLALLTADLYQMGDLLPTAMTTARALLCVNCRRLNAAQGKCVGQSLERCLLLRELGP